MSRKMAVNDDLFKCKMPQGNVLKRLSSNCSNNKVLLKNQADDQKTFYAKARICDFCLKRSLSSHRCLECKASQYCSTQCQREDLTFHTTVCSTWAKDKFRKLVGAKHQQKRNKSFVDDYFK